MKRKATMALVGLCSAVAGLIPQAAFAGTPRQSSKMVSPLQTGQTRAGDFFIVCPAGTSPSPFQMPIYDDDGLFVVGYETVWYCLDVDLEPAG